MGPSRGYEQIAVSSMLITPPNTYSHGRPSWSKILPLQDAATRPGTWLMPVASGA
jgi:hypothetical protein